MLLRGPRCGNFTLWSLSLSALLLTSAGCSAEPARARASAVESTLPVRLSPVERGSFQLPVHAAGTLGARHELELSFKVGGVVTQVPLEQGAHVRKGQLLASIDATELEAQLSQSRQALEKAERDMTRIRALQERGSLPLVDAQNAATSLAVARAALDAAAFNLHHARLVAPESGVIDKRLVHVGEVVAAGRPVFRISTSGRGPVARVGLVDREVLAVKLGDHGRVRLDARPDQTFDAHVTQVASMASPSTGTFAVELTIDAASAAALPSGLTVKVELDHLETEAVRVPVSALVDGSGREAAVFALAGSRARRIPVQVRQLSGDTAWLSSRLDGVDQVVSTGASLLRDGALISARN